jgi:HD-GYP domain-containing protein (c-di-GMP phosphodiesterase class II)
MDTHFTPLIPRDRRMMTLLEMAVEGETITRNHGLNVARIAQQMSIELGCTPVFVKAIYLSCYYHDIGKNYIPLRILNKPDKLSYQERILVQEHSVFGYIETKKSLVNYACNFSFYEQHMIEMINLSHHERFDGTGYPLGLKGHEIPLASRICSYGDVYDALTSGRTYKPQSTSMDALKLINENTPGQVDPDLTEAFLCSVKALNI